MYRDATTATRNTIARGKKSLWVVGWGCAAAGCLGWGSAPAAAGVVSLIDYPDPGIVLEIDPVTGAAWLVGQPGAVMSQYTITSDSGSLIVSNLLTVETQYNNGVTGLGNYVSWMNMSDQANVPPRIWDKCCPANDPTADGRIYFDHLTNRTLELGTIFVTGGIEDWVFAYSYGYLTDDFGWQLIGYGTDPKPGIDGVSALGSVVYVPEPASLIVLLASLSLVVERPRRRRSISR